MTNFAVTLPSPQSDLAQQTLKDPYIFDFLTLSDEAHERELETGLVPGKTHNRVIAEYALRDMSKPIGVAEWHTKLVQSLPEPLRSNLPTIEQIEAELGG